MWNCSTVANICGIGGGDEILTNYTKRALWRYSFKCIHFIRFYLHFKQICQSHRGNKHSPNVEINMRHLNREWNDLVLSPLNEESKQGWKDKLFWGEYNEYFRTRKCMKKSTWEKLLWCRQSNFVFLTALSHLKFRMYWRIFSKYPRQCQLYMGKESKRFLSSNVHATITLKQGRIFYRNVF